MKKVVCSIAALVAALSAPLGAQWQGPVAPANSASTGGPFWDNWSRDGNFCNAGYVLTGQAGNGNAANACISDNQRPAGWLPYAGTAPDQYYGTAGGAWAGFLISPGTYTLSLLPGSPDGGDIAGGNVDWGYFTFNGSGGRDRTSLNGTGALPVTPAGFTGSWGLYISLYPSGPIAYSDTDNQFAAFGFANGTKSVLFGLEDDASRGSDWDYNDIMFKMTWEGDGRITETVPEPASMTLLATGLVGLAGMTRRRRKQK